MAVPASSKKLYNKILGQAIAFCLIYLKLNIIGKRRRIRHLGQSFGLSRRLGCTLCRRRTFRAATRAAAGRAEKRGGGRGDSRRDEPLSRNAPKGELHRPCPPRFSVPRRRRGTVAARSCSPSPHCGRAGRQPFPKRTAAAASIILDLQRQW